RKVRQRTLSSFVSTLLKPLLGFTKICSATGIACVEICASLKWYLHENHIYSKISWSGRST
ncbi:MAG TPA: hypothetical protein VE619_07665, partial [Nitrososphaeraceae archaeon]|nr:hypothetical protein [Nitrososphaeraceae archaeon]